MLQSIQYFSTCSALLGRLRHEYVMAPICTPLNFELGFPRFLIIAGAPIEGDTSATPATAAADLVMNCRRDSARSFFVKMIFHRWIGLEGVENMLCEG